MDLTSSLTVIGIVCLAVATYAHNKGVDSLTIVGTLAVAIGAGLIIIGRHVVRHNRPVRGKIEGIVVPTLIAGAVIAIVSSMVIVNGLPPKDYLALFGIIAVGFAGFIIVIKHS